MGMNEGENERYDMLVNGDIRKVVPRLAVPTIISMMVSSIYNMADTFFVSQLGTRDVYKRQMLLNIPASTGSARLV